MLNIAWSFFALFSPLFVKAKIPVKAEFRAMTINMRKYPKYLVLYTVVRKQYLSITAAITSNATMNFILVDLLTLIHLKNKVVSCSNASTYGYLCSWLPNAWILEPISFGDTSWFLETVLLSKSASVSWLWSPPALASALSSISGVGCLWIENG